MGGMKVVLTTLPNEGQFYDWTTSERFLSPKVKYIPLGILSLLTNLPVECTTTIFDPASDGWTIAETIQNIENEKPDIVGISAVSRKVYALKYLLECLTAPYIAVGGPHCTYYPDTLLEWGADGVFIGALADEEFAQASITKPKGKVYCDSNINTIKFPDRSQIDLNKYLFKDKVLFKAPQRMPMFSSIGCPNRCYFCNVQTKKVKLKNPKIILDEMEAMIQLGCGSVHVLDDNFNFYSTHLRGILDEMEQRNWAIEWSGRGQVRMDFSLVPKMKEHGFKRIHVGFEAFDDKILTFLHKPQKMKDIEKFCEVMNKNDIDMLGYIILGTPVETEQYRKDIKTIVRNLNIKFPYFNLLFPEPDTQYYKSLLEDDYYTNDLWESYMKNPTPDFEIPYPYGEGKKQEVFSFYEEIIEEFTC